MSYPDDQRAAKRQAAREVIEQVLSDGEWQLGLDTSEYSFGYALGWKSGDPDKAREQIKASGARIHQASQKIIDGLDAQKSAERDVEIEAA